MKALFALIVTVLCLTGIHAQQQVATDSAKTEEAARKWLANQYDQGVMVTEDSILITAEVQGILASEKLQQILYPETYTWEVAVALLERMEIKKAFWYFINLYPEHQDLVMKSVLHYEHLFEVDHVLLAAYYTFAFADPGVCTVTDGKPVVTRPDIVEEKLYTVKEMIQKVAQYRVMTSSGDQ